MPVEVIDLREEADKVAELFSSSAEDRDITLQVQGHARATGDRLMIQRAISNLLSNAIRHGLSGSVITLTLATHEDEVSLAVRNAGMASMPNTCHACSIVSIGCMSAARDSRAGPGLGWQLCVPS